MKINGNSSQEIYRKIDWKISSLIFEGMGEGRVQINPEKELSLIWGKKNQKPKVAYLDFTSFTGSLVSLATASNEKLLSVDFRENVS